MSQSTGFKLKDRWHLVHFLSPADPCFVFSCAVIHDNKYLLLLICSPSYVSDAHLDECRPPSKFLISDNETLQLALITVVFSFNYNATADGVLLRFTYGSLQNPARDKTSSPWKSSRVCRRDSTEQSWDLIKHDCAAVISTARYR